MGSQDSAMFASNFDVPSFEKDDFYESFQAPKFHDFSAPEEPMDPDAFFMAQPGMATRKAVVMEDVKTMAPKIHKVTAQDGPKTAQQVPPKTPVVAEKTVWSSKNPCSYLLPLVMSNLKMLGSLSPFCTFKAYNELYWSSMNIHKPAEEGFNFTMKDGQLRIHRSWDSTYIPEDMKARTQRLAIISCVEGTFVDKEGSSSASGSRESSYCPPELSGNNFVEA